jgi:hypothetical protein
MSFRKDFKIIFFAEKIGFKMALWEKWVAVLSQCGKRRWDEEKKE